MALIQIKTCFQVIILTWVFSFTIACSSPPSSSTTQNQNVPLLGADRSPEGCITSAGYSWCEKTQQCERWWELTVKEGLQKDPSAFKAFCGNNDMK